MDLLEVGVDVHVDDIDGNCSSQDSTQQLKLSPSIMQDDDMIPQITQNNFNILDQLLNISVRLLDAFTKPSS